jgi:hypothetical protein
LVRESVVRVGLIKSIGHHGEIAPRHIRVPIDGAPTSGKAGGAGFVGLKGVTDHLIRRSSQGIPIVQKKEERN